MCSKGNLTSILLALSGVFLLGATGAMFMGTLLLVTHDFVIAYGERVTSWGGVFIFTSLSLGVITIFGFYGARKHNKFILLLVSILHAVNIILLFSVGVNILVVIAPQYSDEIVEGCSNRGGVSLWPSPECSTWANDVTTSRLFRLWVTIFSEGLEDSARQLEAVDIEDANFCCGWGPPAKCTGDELATDPDLILRSDQPVMETMNMCSEYAGWYHETEYCSMVPPSGSQRGCPYMLSVNAACIRDNNLRPGCALYFQQYMIGRLHPLGVVSLLIVGFEVLGLITTLCLMLKRKYWDILPKRKKFVDPHFEQYRFGSVQRGAEGESGSEEAENEAEGPSDSKGGVALESDVQQAV